MRNRSRTIARWRMLPGSSLVVALLLASTGCFFAPHEANPYYGRVVVPHEQEFRWSDGGLPQTFDPALAAAPPDTDAVRALFEGLTDYDPVTLAPVPGVAVRWESSNNARQWTFHLRRDALWSNGDQVTAQDFVRSWRRVVQLGDHAPHVRLFENIASPEAQAHTAQTPAEISQASPALGVEALDQYTLRVQLQQPDEDFPALAAHPVFRPVHDSSPTVSGESPPKLVSNGAFNLQGTANSSVVLQRAAQYWDARAVSLERVRFVDARDAESALAAYRDGEVDAVTNAAVEPLALKLLAPYRDSRHNTFAATTYYIFNTTRRPFDDQRVRQALALALDRDRLSEGTMGGASVPARRFLPEAMPGAEKLDADGAIDDARRAQDLLAAAGFPRGAGFPRVRLLVNRNDQQKSLAQAIAEMWHAVLGIETEIVLKNRDEYESALRAGDFDLARRGFVMQTTDELSNMEAMFGAGGVGFVPSTNSASGASPAGKESPSSGNEGIQGRSKAAGPQAVGTPKPRAAGPVSEAEAVRQMTAIPIYFKSANALVKPYVVGFDSNLLGLPSLKRVRIDIGWQAPAQTPAVWWR